MVVGGGTEEDPPLLPAHADRLGEVGEFPPLGAEAKDTVGTRVKAATLRAGEEEEVGDVLGVEVGAPGGEEE